MNIDSLLQNSNLLTSQPQMPASQIFNPGFLSFSQAQFSKNFFFHIPEKNLSHSGFSLFPTSSDSNPTVIPSNYGPDLLQLPNNNLPQTSLLTSQNIIIAENPLQIAPRGTLPGSSIEEYEDSPTNNFDELLLKNEPSDDQESEEKEIERQERIKKGWTDSHDETLLALASKYKCDWKKIAKKFDNKKFTPYFLKIRYKELIDAPVNKKKKFTHEEDLLLADLFKTHGSDWVAIATHYKNRTPVMLKNRYYSFIRKRGLLDQLVNEAVTKTSPPVSMKDLESIKEMTNESQTDSQQGSESIENVNLPVYASQKSPDYRLFQESDLSDTILQLEGPSDELQERITPFREFESSFLGKNDSCFFQMAFPQVGNYHGFAQQYKGFFNY